LIITEAKNARFFVCKQTGFVYQEIRDFVKMTLTRFSSHWLWLESSPNHQKSWLESRCHWWPPCTQGVKLNLRVAPPLLPRGTFKI